MDQHLSPAFPFTPQDFSVGAVLPMMLYLFRWGSRRGKGQFAATYGRDGPPTISSTVDRLISDGVIEGFDTASGRAILGDFLLTSILENRRHSGRTTSRSSAASRTTTMHLGSTCP